MYRKTEEGGEGTRVRGKPKEGGGGIKRAMEIKPEIKRYKAVSTATRTFLIFFLLNEDYIKTGNFLDAFFFRSYRLYRFTL